ncbi:hypothetical protein SAMN05444004_1315 [Jannaschia faecimaris]|uniref:Uncharacterized protein n=1 Tax=Jannaschia faecimaris TaxID=1244108 RepID=A0A1H3UE46_9RHOB|nr:hypothetical protein SAMN05444004_1315 [Jannaschia faecimaris]
MQHAASGGSEPIRDLGTKHFIRRERRSLDVRCAAYERQLCGTLPRLASVGQTGASGLLQPLTGVVTAAAQLHRNSIRAPQIILERRAWAAQTMLPYAIQTDMPRGTGAASLDLVAAFKPIPNSHIPIGPAKCCIHPGRRKAASLVGGGPWHVFRDSGVGLKVANPAVAGAGDQTRLDRPWQGVAFKPATRSPSDRCRAGSARSPRH